MPKPQWLQDIENEKKIQYEYCFNCIHYGPVIGWTKHKGKEIVEVHECAIHPGCFNTSYSIRCEDYKVM
jgi:hypothetical protein